MSLWGRKPFVYVRILGPDGGYPPFGVETGSHILRVRRNLVWTAVLQQPLPEDWETSENPTLLPEEIRLQTAIALCVEDPWRHGYTIVTPLRHGHELAIKEGETLQTPSVREEVDQVVVRLMEELGINVGGFKYSFHERADEESLKALLDRFDSGDQLLLAGLGYFLGAARLSAGGVYEPEAVALMLFVSMGAALEYIRLYLNQERGVSNTSFGDVHDYLASVYPEGNYIRDYLEEMYEHRIIAIHPAGRFGEYWTPPLMADDLFDLRKHISVIWRHILLGDRPNLA